MFFDQKPQLLRKVKNFLEGEQWYSERGIPYTLGILLHGEPGCGKTSFIKALLKHIDSYRSQYMGRTHGIYVNLHDSFDFDTLDGLISKTRIGEWDIPLDQRLFIFEDIDCMGDVVKDRDLIDREEQLRNKHINRYLSLKYKKSVTPDTTKSTDSKDTTKAPDSTKATDTTKSPDSKDTTKASDTTDTTDTDSDNDDNIKRLLPYTMKPPTDHKNSLSRLLNILDGIIETPGRIIIMTTNKLDKLDKALIRPGRIDIQIDFTKCSKGMTRDIINNFYGINLSQGVFENMEEFVMTPAELIQQCFLFDDYKLLLKRLNID